MDYNIYIYIYIINIPRTATYIGATAIDAYKWNKYNIIQLLMHVGFHIQSFTSNIIEYHI